MEYEGAVILISHDRHLIEATADRLWIVENGTVRSYDGDMESYRSELLAERGTRTRAQANQDDQPKATRADARREAAQRRAELAPLKKAMQQAEKAVEKITADIAKLDALLGDASLYTRDPAKAKAATIEHGLISKKLAEAEEAWLIATDAYETAAAAAESADA